jgi:glucosyl-3-phosphoglycerate synthase
MIEPTLVGTLVDELIVLDDDSTDGTDEIAAEAGATVVPVDFVHFFHGAERGKGNALWASLLASAGDIVVWIDGDITSFTTDWIVRLVVPLLIDDELGLVKANYERPSHLGGGGRTTELVARPLLSMYFPDIADLQQPLAGEFAGRRSMLEAIPFATGWGVEIGMLIDMAEKFGIQSLGQVDLGVRLHRHHKLETLAIQAAEVAATLLLRTPYPPDFAEDVPMLHRKELGPIQLNIGERPPVNSLPKMPQLPHSDRR